MFKKEAKRWLDLGLSPIPLVSGQKRPALVEWQRYCDKPATKEKFEEWCSKMPNANVGLCMGTRLDGDLQLGCVDIDDDALVDTVRRALGGSLFAKRGHKGQTVLVAAPIKERTSRIRSLDADGKPSRTPAVEILLHGTQTVMPPSLHPDGETYRWLDDKPTKKKDIADLPILDAAVLDEIKAVCEGKGQLFDALNAMVWLGVGEGGDTHDACVSVVALMVSRQWKDEAIHKRIERAKREACETAGETYNWTQAAKTIQEWIDSARGKGMAKPKDKKIPPERQMAEWGLFELGGVENVSTVYGLLRTYRNGHWPEVDEPTLTTSMYNINAILREREARSALSILRTICSVSGFGITPGCDPKEDKKRKRICLQNGTINLSSGELEPHSADHELLHQLDFDWDDKAECPLYESVLDFTFDKEKDAIQLWDEFCALTLIDDMSFQKMLFLKGPGGNGKGTLARVLRNMHARGAVGSVGITELNSERKRTSLVGKLINISGEQSRLNLVSDTYLKKITGEDPIDVRRLYAETVNDVYLSVRFLELVNEMPSTSDSSYALGRRLMILNCPNKVAKPDADLDGKLIKERPGILRRWVAAMDRLYKRGRFAIPQQSVDETEEYLNENDSVSYWLNVAAEANHEGTLSSELYGYYLEWARASGFKFYASIVGWGKRMKALGYPVRVTKGADGKSARIRQVKAKVAGEF